MDKGKEINKNNETIENINKSYYQMDEYEGGTSQTLSFKPETCRKTQSETE